MLTSRLRVNIVRKKAEDCAGALIPVSLGNLFSREENVSKRKLGMPIPKRSSSMKSSFSGDRLFLNPFYEAPVTYNGICYSCIESAYQAQKSVLPEVWEEYSHYSGPVARARGKRGVERSGWGKMRDEVMYEVIWNSVEQNPEIADRLCKIEDETIVFYNDVHDNYYGECQCNECVERQKHNRIGKMWTQVRDEKRSGHGRSEFKTEEQPAT